MYPNKITKIAQEELKKTHGGREYFDIIDHQLKLPKNLDIIKSVFNQINKEQGKDFNLILTGGFGDWILSLIKKGVIKVPNNVVSTNGSIRGSGNTLDKYTKGKEVDIIHKKGDIDNQQFVLFDDSFYSGSTKKALEEFLKKYNSNIYKTYVVYDGNDKKDKNRFSLYRYYDYHSGTELSVDLLIDYLYGLNVDIPKDTIKDKILKGEIKTINDVRKNVNNLIGKFGKSEKMPKITREREREIIKSFESFEYFIFIVGETIDLF